MINKVSLAFISTAIICTTVFAADGGSSDRDGMTLETSRKERMAPVSAQQDEDLPRATIDVNDAAFPKSAPAEMPENVAAPAVEEPAVIEEAIEPQTQPAVSGSQAPVKVIEQAKAEDKPVKQKPKKVIWRWGFKKAPAEEEAPAPKVETPTVSMSPALEDAAPVTATEPAQAKEKPVKEKPKKVVFRWRTPPPKEVPIEDSIQRKIEGRRFKGETGFTTVTTYRLSGAKISGDQTGPISAQDAPVMLGVDDCIKIAEANNIQAIVAKKSIKLAEMRVFEARRNLLPTATIVVERYKGRVNDQDYLGRKQYIEGQQPVFAGGKLYFEMKQAETNLAIAKNDYNRVANELILQVKKAYYTLEKAKENSALQHILSGEVERIYGISAKGHDEGAIAKVEYLNVSSQTGQIKYQLASADGDVSVAELILRQAMNVNLREKFDIIPSPEFKKVTLDFEKTVRDAFSNRPEMKANSLMVTYYGYGQGIANAKSLPKVDLLGQWGLTWEDFVPSTASPDPRRKLAPQWYAGIKVGVPFAGNTAEYAYTREQWQPVVQSYQGTEATVNQFKFKILDRLDMYSDKQLADIDYDRSRQELNKTRNDVTLEVREGCFNYEKAVIQLETAANKVKYQEADAELMKMKRGMDEVQDSNVVDSLIKVAQEKFGYVQAVTDCKISLAALEKAVGVQGYFKDK